MKLNPHLKKFWKTKAQIRVLYGGRMSSKTMDTAGVMAYIASKYKVRILCLRRFQNKLDESVYSTIKKVIEEDARLAPLFKITERTIKGINGSEFLFLGIERNLAELKGLDNISITWIEESEKLTEAQWNIIRPTILREQSSFCVAVFNPAYDTDFIYKEFVLKKHDNVIVQKINYDKNPFLSKSARDLIESDRKKLDEDDFNHIYLGMPKAESESAIIKRAWLYECIDAHKKLNIEPTGQSFIGYDVADDGNDANAYVLRNGFLCVDIQKWNAGENELLKSTQRVYAKARESDATIIYDSIGVGASVGSKIKELNEANGTTIKAIKFNAGSSVQNPTADYSYKIKNKDFFANLKAQAWWDVAERIKETYNAIKNGKAIEEDRVIAISSECKNIEELIIELSTPLKDFDNNGKVKVESKKDLAKRAVPSTNIGDAFIMAFFKAKSGGFFS